MQVTATEAKNRFGSICAEANAPQLQYSKTGAPILLFCRTQISKV